MFCPFLDVVQQAVLDNFQIVITNYQSNLVMKLTVALRDIFLFKGVRSLIAYPEVSPPLSEPYLRSS